MFFRSQRLLKGLLVWYIVFSAWMAISPVDRQFWLMANVLPALFVGLLVVTHRRYPLSHGSYALITLFLTLHTIGVHYTYAEVPLGFWMEQAFDWNRNHFDRLVHFSFGLLLTYPMMEVFARFLQISGFVFYYLTVMTPLGFSGLWEIIEAWVAQSVHPELGITYLGSQGDIWDAQKDMAAATYGAILCVVLTLAVRRLLNRTATIS